LTAATKIAGKDLKLRVRDRSAIILGIVVPLVLAYIFHLVFGGALTTGSLDLRYGLVDDDMSPVSSAFAEALDDLEAGEVLTYESYPDPESAESAIADGDIAAFFEIPEGFGAGVLSGSGGRIRVVGDVDSPTATQIAASIAGQFATGVETANLAIATTSELSGVPVGPELIAGLEEDPSSAAFSFTLEDVAAATRLLDPNTFFAAGMAVFFLFFTVQFGVAGLLEEEREGTLARLLAAPISRSSVIGGKAILAFALGVISMTVLIVATRFLMGADWGPPLGVALLVGAGVSSAVGVMGLVASFARSPEAAGNLGSIIAVILGMLGGTFFPVGQGDDFLSRLSYITPHAWFMRGLGDIAGGASWTAALPAAAAMAAFAAVCGGTALFLVRRRVAG
jgi:ABC-2 type transport system permease protein